MQISHVCDSSILDAPLQIQLPSGVLGKAAENICTWSPARIWETSGKLLALAWPSPEHCSSLGSEPVYGISSSLFASHTFSTFQTDISCIKKTIFGHYEDTIGNPLCLSKQSEVTIAFLGSKCYINCSWSSFCLCDPDFSF